MKSKLLPIIFCFFIFASFAFAQKSRKLDEFSYLPCDDLLARADGDSQELQKEPGAKMYFIYYEGNQKHINIYNKKLKSYETKELNPRRGDALNRTKDLTLYLTKYRKIPKGKLVLINGGYMENYEVEIWIVPKDAEPPKPAPTVDEKDVKFRKGKPFRTRDCESYYLSL